MYKCFSCGFETRDKGLFLRLQGDGDHSWLQMSCPQCFLSSPPVGEVGESVPFKEPRWGLVTTNHGLCVWHEYSRGSGRSITPMIREHQLAFGSTSLLDPSLKEMTLWEYSRLLAAEGTVRNNAFHVETKDIMVKFPIKVVDLPATSQIGISDPLKEAREAELDLCRKKHRVGPYEERREWTFSGGKLREHDLERAAS